MTYRRRSPETKPLASSPKDWLTSSPPTSGIPSPPPLPTLPLLAAEITELRAELAGVRLDRANLAAAALATIAAHQDGEPDPLSYLRDELARPGLPAAIGAAHDPVPSGCDGTPERCAATDSSPWSSSTLATRCQTGRS